jgi:hypothetical protein
MIEPTKERDMEANGSAERGFLTDVRQRYREAKRSTRIFGAFVGVLLLGFVAYFVIASIATFVAIDANEDAAHTPAPPTSK